MKRLLFALLIFPTLHASWTVEGDWFFAATQSGTWGFIPFAGYSSAAGRVSATYGQGIYNLGGSYLVSYGDPSDSFTTSEGSIWYHSATAHTGLGCSIWRLHFGARTLVRYVDWRLSTESRVGFFLPIVETEKKSIQAIGGGGGVNLHLDLFFGLSVGGEMDLLGFYTWEKKKINGKGASYSGGQLGGDLDLHLQYKLQLPCVALCIRLGIYGEVIESPLYFSGTYLGAALSF